MVIIEQMDRYVKQNMSPCRYQHTLGVIETAKKLSYIYDVDESKVWIAALFHDVAKELSLDEKIKYCKKYHIEIDDYIREQMDLAHGMIAAHMIKEKFNIDDKDILNAISYHTLGRRGMSKLEKIIYLSDMIEPYRKTYPMLEKLRKLAYIDLDSAMKEALRSTCEYIYSQNKKPHPIIYSILQDYENSSICNANGHIL